MSVSVSYNNIPYEALAGRLEVLEIEIQDKRETIQHLRDALMEAKEHEQKSVESALRHANQQFERIQDDLQKRLTNQLRIIDRLTNDKMELTRQMELCAAEINRLKERNEIDVRNATEDALRQAEKSKKLTAAQEKAQREAWEKKKEDEIKERTVRALEPQIDTILSEQKALRRRLEAKFEEEREALHRRFSQEMQEGMRRAREDARRAAEEEIESARKGFLERSRLEFEAAQKLLEEERDAHMKLLAQERDRQASALRVAQEDYRRKLELKGGEAKEVYEPQIESLKAALRASEEARLAVEGAVGIRNESMLREKIEEVRSMLQRDADQKVEEVRRQADEQLHFKIQEMTRRLAADLAQELEVADRNKQMEMDLLRKECERKVTQMTELLQEAKNDLRRVGSSSVEKDDQLDHLRAKIEQMEASLRTSETRLAEAETRSFKAESELRSAKVEFEDRIKLAVESANQGHQEHLRDVQYELSELKRQAADANARAERAEALLQQAHEEASARIRSAEDRMKAANEANLRALQISESKVVHFQALLDRQRAELLGKLR